MSAYLVSTSNLVKSFGKSKVLKDLNMQVPKGISGFIGKNGAGKTTTIGVFLGLLKPTNGEATIFGLDSWRDSYEIRRRLGVMHEVNAYPRGFTARSFLEQVAHIYGVAQVDRHVNELLSDVGLVNAKDKPIRTFSAGMFKRLGLAQALIGSPEFVILDEPTANIDPLGRVDILEKIKEMNREHGTSFLISTHILSDLEKICNWLTIIDAGQIVDQGTVRDLAGKYSANTYKVDISNPELFADMVQKTGIAEKVWIENHKVYCKVSDVAVFCNKAPKIVVEFNLQLKGFQQVIGTLEDIYSKTSGGA
jgi:ABC-2 type transport system ATP-binding protein